MVKEKYRKVLKVGKKCRDFDVNKKMFPVSEPYKQLWRQGVPLPFSLTLVFTQRSLSSKLHTFLLLLDYHSHTSTSLPFSLDANGQIHIVRLKLRRNSLAKEVITTNTCSVNIMRQFFTSCLHVKLSTNSGSSN